MRPVPASLPASVCAEVTMQVLVDLSSTNALLFSQPAFLLYCAWFRGRGFCLSGFPATARMLAEVRCCVLVIAILLQTCGAYDAMSMGAAGHHQPQQHPKTQSHQLHACCKCLRQNRAAHLDALVMLSN